MILLLLCSSSCMTHAVSLALDLSLSLLSYMHVVDRVPRLHAPCLPLILSRLVSCHATAVVRFEAARASPFVCVLHGHCSPLFTLSAHRHADTKTRGERVRGYTQAVRPFIPSSSLRLTSFSLSFPVSLRLSFVPPLLLLLLLPSLSDGSCKKHEG